MSIVSIIMRILYGLMLVFGVAVSVMAAVQTYKHGAGFDAALGTFAMVLVVFVISIAVLMLLLGRLWGIRRR